MSTLKDYIDNFKDLLAEADSAKCKTILRSFVRQIAIDTGRVTVEYKLPVPENERNKELVLPIVTLVEPGLQ